ncbi:hypothetical protein OAI05_04810, partial [Planktomarina temperata]|nr:hypothetical protein [Planktomarina temperata]
AGAPARRPCGAPSSTQPKSAIDRATAVGGLGRGRLLRLEISFCSQFAARPIAVVAKLVLSRAGIICQTRAFDTVSWPDL